MKFSQLFITTLKEIPAEAQVESHKLMLRAGLIRKLSSGLYTFCPLGLMSLKKVENIVRQEMNRAGALEFLPPILIPKELWEESGRYEAMGPVMMKMKDRNDRTFVLGPTHEEVFTDIVREQLKSYKDLPVNLYQIHTKFRDEIRPRFGVIRSREFIMKDAYSFNRDNKSLDETYKAMQKAYTTIFDRCGLETVVVSADSGAMGGTGSEEFMVKSEIGEDTILECEKCSYLSNQEKAEASPEPINEKEKAEQVELIDTPNVKTIEELTDFLKISPKKFIKTIIYKNMSLENENKYVMVLIRGDIEVNEVKLVNSLGGIELAMAADNEINDELDLNVGFLGALNLDKIKNKKKIFVIADNSVKNIVNGITGANQKDKHYKGIQANRDLDIDEYRDLRLVVGGDLCPKCKSPLISYKGIEVGHIFKLGQKYTKSLKAIYLDEDGKEQIPTMGCYGIGVSRILAAVIEQHHDKFGISWPFSVAPLHVVIIPVNTSKKEHMDIAFDIYNKLMENNVEVIIDDRDARPGFKFKDADLIGFPIRITIGDKGLAEKSVEYKLRDREKAELVSIDSVIERVNDDIKKNMK